MSVEATLKKREATINDELYEKAVEARKRRAPGIVKSAVNEILSKLEDAAENGDFAIVKHLDFETKNHVQEILAELRDDCGVSAREHVDMPGTIIAELTAPPAAESIVE